MSPTSSLAITTQIYADTANVRNCINDDLSTDTELLDQSPFEDLYDHTHILREVHSGLITYKPVRHMHIM